VFPRFGGNSLHVGRWLAVKLDELDHIDTGRQLNPPLLKPCKRIINLLDLDPASSSKTLPWGRSVLLTAVAEENADAAVTLLNFSHRRGSSVNATL
jgi:hypothetical protein